MTPLKLMSLTDYFLSFSRDNESNPLVFSRAQVIYVDGITSVVFTRCQDHFPDISRKCTFFESLSGMAATRRLWDGSISENVQGPKKFHARIIWTNNKYSNGKVIQLSSPSCI